ncbi:hypothetical protein [Streptomyces pakalii]|uniref:Uncharacterized protein n=1 Tax=Streptomyces pakalii TaxID=3036494 RepID=A0ABT7DGV4_9ACTN|nr:hypothetical protein [Streptomyces pakalii]MDJ1645022.1 hypothetical protein [Streptomyces pakalii]
MDAIQQHMLDTYRAAQLSEPAPPPPGRHDRAGLRDLYRHWLTHPPHPARPAFEDGTLGPGPGPLDGGPDMSSPSGA